MSSTKKGHLSKRTLRVELGSHHCSFSPINFLHSFLLGVPAAQLVGRRSWRRGQTAGGGSIPRWSTGKPQVVTRRMATGAGKKKQAFFLTT